MFVISSCGFSEAALLDCSTIELREEVRKMCAADTCGMYGKNWSCPPACGSLEECREKVRGYRFGILVQTIGELEDSWDYEGMQEGQERQKEHCMAFLKELRKVYKDILPLCSAGCDISRVLAA